MNFLRQNLLYSFGLVAMITVTTLICVSIKTANAAKGFETLPVRSEYNRANIQAKCNIFNTDRMQFEVMDKISRCLDKKDLEIQDLRQLLHK